MVLEARIGEIDSIGIPARSVLHQRSRRRAGRALGHAFGAFRAEKLRNGQALRVAESGRDGLHLAVLQRGKNRLPGHLAQHVG